MANSPGAMLRAAREKQGLHIAALAAAIKVAPRKLDALENDRWAELPDATFARALAQTVCRTLKIDARPILELLPAPNAGTLENAGGRLNAPFNQRAGRDEPGIAGAAIKPMVAAAVVLMVAAVVVYLLPDGVLDGWGGAPAASAPAVVSLPASAVVAAPTGAAPAAAPAASDVAAVAQAGAASAAASAPGAGTAATPAAPVVETVFSAPAAASAPPAGLVQLRSSEPSWVEARDARGTVLLSRTIQPGESVGLDGVLPIRLTIGNAAATQLGFRGQPVDLAPRTRDNVARIELP